MKKQIKALVHEALKRPRLEELLSLAYRRAPRELRPFVRKLAPQPGSYERGEERIIERGGLRWVMNPFAHFQWLQYFAFDDPVLDTLLLLAARARVILDVGANVGFYSLLMARAAGPRAEVHSFEPHPTTFAHLARHLEMNPTPSVHLHAFALGAEEAALPLYDGRDAGKSSLELSADREQAPTHTVRVSTLDDFAQSAGLGGLDLVKIDVEGFEPEVLAGGKRTLAAHRPALCFELTPAWYGSGPRQDLARETFTWLAGLGYDFFRVAPPERGGRLLERTSLLAEVDRREGPKQVNLVALAPETSAAIGDARS